jgi:hypothetical protein
MIVVASGSLAVTAAIVALVFSLAGWAYRQRGSSLHEGRLQRAVAQHPTEAQIAAALLAEGARAVPVPPSEDELRRLLGRWPGARVEEVLAKRRRSSGLAMYEVGEMVYVLFFDAADKLQDYELGRR